MAVWISHRGIRDGNVVENTRESFAAAVRRGFKWLETDIRMTADHHLVLVHDEDFGRVSEDDRPIMKLSRSQIESIILDDGQRPLFLDEFLETHQKQSWVFDMKMPDSQAAISLLSRALTEKFSMPELTRKVKFVAWSKNDEDLIREKLPGCEIYAREPECWRAGLSSIYFGGICSGIQSGKTYSLPSQLRGRKLFTKDLVASYHAKKARVIAFLPRTEVEAKEALSAGFDEILSDGWILSK